MSNVFTDQLRTNHVVDFINTFKYDFGSQNPPGPSQSLPNYLFFGLGRKSEWVGVDINDDNPPVVTGSEDDIYVAWSNMLGLVQVTNENILPITYRWNWQDGRDGKIDFVPLDQQQTLSSTFNSVTPYYCLNTDNNLAKDLTNQGLWQVYQLIQKNTSAQPSIRPVHTSGDFDSGDGYTWRYLYTLSQKDRDFALSDDWMPIIYNYASSASLTANEEQSTYILRTLQCSRVMIGATLNTIDNPINDIPVFRQISLISNPLNVNTGNRLSDLYSVAYDGSLTGNIRTVNPHTGRMLYLENLTPVYRSEGQTENLKVVIEF